MVEAENFSEHPRKCLAIRTQGSKFFVI